MEAEQEHSQVSMEAIMTLDDDDVSESSFHHVGGGNGSEDANNNGGCAWPSPSLMERPPPPFVLKTYDMVNDHNTNSIISWNPTGTSLIVWDAHRFAAEVMTRYFRHNNFSSFVCQLNTYGFKKISWDKWEFHNDWFQKGKMSWLKNIKRKTGNLKLVQQAKAAEAIEQINERNVLHEEIIVLKKKLEDAEKELEMIKAEMQISKRKQKKMVMFLAREFLKERREWDSIAAAKKPRVSEQENTDQSLVEPVDSKKPRSENANKMIQDNEKVDNANAGSIHDPVFDNEKYEQIEKLLLNDLNIENVPGEEMAAQQSKIVIELEDLLGKRVDWAECVGDLGDKARCLKSEQ